MHHKQEFYDKVWDKTKASDGTHAVCHVCGDSTLTKDPRNWYADHIVPFDRGGDDDDADNFLPVCHRCNGLRWHNSPETIRRILFLGVIANTTGYQQPFSKQAAGIRDMRRTRLVDNWKRRKAQRSMNGDQLKRKIDEIATQFKEFED